MPLRHNLSSRLAIVLLWISRIEVPRSTLGLLHSDVAVIRIVLHLTILGPPLDTLPLSISIQEQDYNPLHIYV
jgi:hypothetical protein